MKLKFSVEHYDRIGTRVFDHRGEVVYMVLRFENHDVPGHLPCWYVMIQDACGHLCAGHNYVSHRCCRCEGQGTVHCVVCSAGDA